MSLNKPSFNQADLLLLEFQEAWSHYRHLETSRTQYLGFFFTVMLGALGFVIALMKDAPSQISSWVMVGLFALVWLLFLITLVLFTGVKKLGVVLRHYECVMKQVRDRFYADDQAIAKSLNVRETDHPVMKRRLFSVQTTAEYLLESFCVLLTFIQVGGFITLSLNSIFTFWQTGVLLVFALSMVFLLIYILGSAA